MTSKPKSATVVDMAQARREHDMMELRLGWKLPDGTRLKPYTLYDPPPPYGAKPCRVISLNGKRRVSLDKEQKDTPTSLF